MSPKVTKELAAGDVIAEDKPLIHVLHEEFKDKYCDSCLTGEASDRLKRCAKCRRMYYCGQRCQKRDWKCGHKYECPVFATAGDDRWPPLDAECDRKCLQLLLRLYLCLKSRPTFATEKHRLFDDTDVTIGAIAAPDIDLEECLEYRQELDTVCRVFTELAVDYERPELIRWFAIVKARRAVGVHGIRCGDPINECMAATGLFVQLSGLSHSCLPNSALVFKNRGQSLELRAIRRIAAGEEITISYVNVCQARTERLNALKDLSIDCQCVKCANNIDHEVEYSLLRPPAILPLHEFGSAAELDAYVRHVLADLSLVYGPYHRYKTLALMAYTKQLMHCPLATRHLFNEVRDECVAGFDVTVRTDCPIDGDFYDRMRAQMIAFTLAVSPS